MKNRHTNIPASYLILIQDNKILLSHRINTGYEDNKLGLVSGHVEKNENFTKAIIREAKEEAGIILNENDLKVAHIMHRKSIDSERVDVFFIADNYSSEIVNSEPDKCLGHLWFDIDSLPENTIQYIKEVISHIKNNVFYSESGW